MIIYLTDSYKEDVVDFVKYHEELYDKASKDCLWERVASSCNLSVKVCKTLFESQRAHYERLTQSKSGQAPKEMIEKQNWIQDQLNFLKTCITRKGINKSLDFQSPHCGASTNAASAHHIS